MNFIAPLESPGSLSSTSIIWGRGGAIPFHKVRGATGSGKDKINHFIWGKRGGAINREMTEIGGVTGELEGREG